MSKENKEQTLHNEAFIDGQNVYLATTTAENAWKIDLQRFRVYLQDKYQVARAYYFIGAADESHRKLYQTIQEAGFILMFRKHSLEMIGHKKGNVDTDIVFTIMAKIADHEKFNKVILVSGDGDYYQTVDYLINKGRFGRLLAPSYHGMSSLYKQYVDRAYYSFLDEPGTKNKIYARKR